MPWNSKKLAQETESCGKCTRTKAWYEVRVLVCMHKHLT